MTILPLIARELSLQSRKPALYWGRFAAGLAGALFCALALKDDGSGIPTDQGGVLFGKLVILLCFMVLSGFVLTCDSIAREKREGTLGLLLLTRVSRLDIVLGKCSILGLGGLSALMAVVPVIAASVIVGGVTGGEVLRMGLALGSLLLLSLSAGIWSSAIGGTHLALALRAAWVLLAVMLVPAIEHLGPILIPIMCLGFVFSFQHSVWGGIKGLLSLLATILIPFLLLVLVSTKSSNAIGRFVFSLNPILAVSKATDTAYQAHPNAYWLSVSGGLFMSVLLIAGAATRLGCSVDDHEVEPPVEEFPDLPVTQQRVPWPQLIGMDPIGWTLLRTPWVGASVWIGTILVFLGTVATGMLGGINRFSVISLAYSMIPYGLFTWVTTEFCWSARQTGALELLSISPLGRQGVSSGYWKALTRVFHKPCLLLLSIGVLCHGLQLCSSRWATDWTLVPALAASAAAFVMMIRTLCAVGSWMSLRAKTRMSAVLATLTLILVVPSIVTATASWLAALITTSIWNRFLVELVTLAYFYWLYRHSMRIVATLDPGDAGLAAEFGALFAWKSWQQDATTEIPGTQRKAKMKTETKNF